MRSQDDPRDDVPEADRAEQEREAWSDDLDDDSVEGVDGGIVEEVDPLKADEADQLDQLRDVPVDDSREPE